MLITAIWRSPPSSVIKEIFEAVIKYSAKLFYLRIGLENAIFSKGRSPEEKIVFSSPSEDK